MAQVDTPATAVAIQRNLTTMSESATGFAVLYLHGVRANDAGLIADARGELREAQRRVLRRQERSQLDEQRLPGSGPSPRRPSRG